MTTPGPDHDVFISYASDDKPVADAVCAGLEAERIRCWIAPRDILPGADWLESIIDAINRARIVVLVFSTRANASAQIKREIERAVSKGKAILPFRIEDVAPSGSLEYLLATQHWLDAISPPVQAHIATLARGVAGLLGVSRSAPTTAGSPTGPSPIDTPRTELDPDEWRRPGKPGRLTRLMRRFLEGGRG
ncbi:MAG: toll/interleukin-1 receptor domain-containing protein [Phycisphaeraceae bacterium]|nr:toll/interleukin-1 receptor domain-containing protein [Phycisphaeraceae bacterium]